MIQEVKDYYEVEINKRPIEILVKGWVAHVDRKNETNRKAIETVKNENISNFDHIVKRIVPIEKWQPQINSELKTKMTQSEGDEIKAEF